ncbi:ABC transporter ATP-binding protein [Microbacterium lacusdiani]
MDLTFPPGRITALIGGNGSVHSVAHRRGSAAAGSAAACCSTGADLRTRSRRDVALTVSLLPQQPMAPEGLTVRGLCECGRHPHRGFLARERREDREIVDRALASAGLGELAERPLDELSGGQRQRAWIAMAPAQATPIMLLDEPTTYLDIAHQLEVLDLLADLNRREGMTIVMVLHELNLAAHYAHHIVALHGGTVHVSGVPAAVMNADMMSAVFGIRAAVVNHPLTRAPLVPPTPETPYTGERAFAPHAR